MRSLYDILGVRKSASSDEVKSAYRKLAKELHPDRNQDDQRVAERFKEVSAAYGILGDADQRARYDAGAIDENGNATRAQQPPPGGHPFGQAGSRAGGGGAEFDFEEASDVFREFFRASGGRQSWRGGGFSGGGGKTGGSGAKSGRQRGLDITYEVTIGFEEAINGSTRRMALTDGRSVDMKIPAGIKDGQIIRLPGQGGDGQRGGGKGDALVEIRVADHPLFSRDGLNVMMDLPISVDEAVLGGDVKVPVPGGGKMTIRIPPGSSSGRRLRLKGKGIKGREGTGHLFVTLKIGLPMDRDKDLERLIKQWRDLRSGDGSTESAGERPGDALRKRAGLD